MQGGQEKVSNTIAEVRTKIESGDDRRACGIGTIERFTELRSFSNAMQMASLTIRRTCACVSALNR